MMDDLDLDALADTLSDFAPPEKKVGRSPREERIVSGFQDIQRFVEKHGHAPRHGESRDIFERIYATRLDRMRVQDDCRVLLESLDNQGLLADGEVSAAAIEGDMDTDALLAELEGAIGASDLSDLRHVRTAEEKRAAEEIANRDKCADFETFKPLFERVQRELESGIRKSREFELKAEIRPGAWFIVGGQKAYVAAMDEIFVNAQGRTDARLRVVFDNGTESNMLMRSLQRALHKDEAGRRISDPEVGPLFAREEASPFTGELDEDDSASGTIYVLRSKSDHPVVAANREVLHKIGVTGGDVQRRISNAKIDATFLLADVEIVSTYTLYNVNRTKLENLIHRIFDPARLEIVIRDRFGNPVVPREWFLVPRFVVDDAVERIKDGTIADYYYDPKAATLVRHSNYSTGGA